MFFGAHVREKTDEFFAHAGPRCCQISQIRIVVLACNRVVSVCNDFSGRGHVKFACLPKLSFNHHLKMSAISQLIEKLKKEDEERKKQTDIHFAEQNRRYAELKQRVDYYNG